MRILRTTLVAVSLLCLASFGLAGDEEMAKPEPTPEHEALGMWVGQWAGSGVLKEGPYGPGGPMSWTESCSWFAGAGFNIVCKSEGTGPMGDSKGLGIIGYNPEKKVYTHYGIDSSGWTALSEGTRDGDLWTFQSKETMGGETVYTRFTLDTADPKKMGFSWQMSEDGESWKTLMEGISEKK